MTKEKRLQYQKAHVELYEILKGLSNDEKEKIPHAFINNLKEDMDKNYTFLFDKSKTLYEQNLMSETKALLVQIYARYLAPENEKRLWNEYNNICINKIEKKRKEKYNPDDIFKNGSTTINNNDISQSIQENLKEEYNKNLPVEMQKQNMFQRLLSFIQKLIHH